MSENRIETGQRDNKGRFAKGNKSGGRPKTPKEFKEIVKKNSIPAINRLIEIMNNDNAKDSDRIRAAEIVIERAYGKAVQPIDADLNGNVDMELNIKVIE